ncbi:MAG: Putative monooxygenase STM1546 [uncultured Caballeronia sp.]|nr:MAG: Putative monooxygenase STM1546 [uncultured Caballeronia sp.]
MPSSRSHTEVLICGAGASGLSLSIDLARKGVSFRLVERLQEPFRGSRGKGIQPRTLEVFEDFELVDRMTATGGPYPPQREYRNDGSYQDTQEFSDLAPTASEPYLMPLMVPQFLTEGVLRERLAELGHVPEFGVELVWFDQDAQGVTARVVTARGEEMISAKYLVGCDGGRSYVRQALEIEFPGKTLGVRAVVADVIATGLSCNVWHRFSGGDMARQISLAPLAGTDMFQIQGPVPAEGDIDLSAQGLTHLVRERAQREDITIDSVSWASIYVMNARLADHYRVGRIFLAGDAAHIHPPTGGQGLNTSVQDAYNLGWKLAAVLNGAPDLVLDSYEQERRPIAAHMLGLTTKYLEAAKADSMHRGRDALQLDLGYPDSPLSVQGPTRGQGVRAGDRAPDAPMRGASGQAVRLFNLFKGSHWTLLGCRVGRLSAVTPRAGLRIHATGARGDLIDVGEHLRETYGLSTGEWVLVRPDGYIAAIVASDQMSILEHYFEGIGLAVP